MPTKDPADLSKAIREFREFCFQYRDKLYSTQTVQSTEPLKQAQDKLSAAIQAYTAAHVAASRKQGEMICGTKYSR